jgi:hypothetical protein
VINTHPLIATADELPPDEIIIYLRSCQIGDPILIRSAREDITCDGIGLGLHWGLHGANDSVAVEYRRHSGRDVNLNGLRNKLSTALYFGEAFISGNLKSAAENGLRGLVTTGICIKSFCISNDCCTRRA